MCGFTTVLECGAVDTSARDRGPCKDEPGGGVTRHNLSPTEGGGGDDGRTECVGCGIPFMLEASPCFDEGLAGVRVAGGKRFAVEDEVAWLKPGGDVERARAGGRGSVLGPKKVDSDIGAGRIAWPPKSQSPLWSICPAPMLALIHGSLTTASTELSV